MREPLGELSELRLILHCYARHTTAALVTRRRDGRENWDRRAHAWDLPLPQGNYSSLPPEDQLWAILAALARTRTLPSTPRRPEAPEPPEGGYGGESWAQPQIEFTD